MTLALVCVAAEVVVRASEETGLDIEEWWARFGQPGSPETVGDLMRRNVNPNGVLRGQQVVFAGKLNTPRRVVAAMAADAGGNGSPEHEQALGLIRQGVKIAIVTESEFRALVS